MAMPGNVLSSSPVPSSFIGARALASFEKVDYEEGPIAIQDVTQGLQAQRWRMRLIEGEFWLDAPTVPECVAYTALGSSEVSFTFDQQGRLVLAYVQDGQPKLYWFDSSAPGFVVTDLPIDAVTPKVILDDKRFTQVQISDVILQYVRNGRLKMRMQRDRFLIEYDLSSGPWTAIAKMGFNRGLRLQTLCRYF
jgi:hypothetical protein